MRVHPLYPHQAMAPMLRGSPAQPQTLALLQAAAPPQTLKQHQTLELLAPQVPQVLFLMHHSQSCGEAAGWWGALSDDTPDAPGAEQGGRGRQAVTKAECEAREYTRCSAGTP